MNNREYWQGNIINSLTDNEVFVFGSNPEGIHGAGGAKAAVAFGAKFGNGRGLMGKAYGLVTKNLNAGFIEKSTGITYHKDGYCSVSESQIIVNIDELYECAKQNPDKKFLITFQYETWPNGTPKKSLNGYTSEEMFQMFVRPDIPSNIVFHDSYKNRLEAVLKSNQNNNSSSKDYILFVNYPSQDILSDSNFWTDLINDLSNVKEHTQGAGLAKHIKQAFPEAFEADKKTGYGDKNKLGTFSEATVNINGHNLTIINAYTQYRYGTDKDHFEYDTFPKLLQSIKAKYGDKKIGIPLIGCGLAGGDEPRILKMIKENLEGVNYKLVEIDTNRKLNLGTQESAKEIAFTKVSLPYGWMGNMAPYPVTHEGVEYKTTEALFQSLRFEKYPEIQKEIIEQKSPMAAKMVAKSHRELLVKDGYKFLGNQDIEYMKLCIDLKLDQHPELAKQLIETGNSVIIEDCSSRPQESGLFWGSAYQNNVWVGKNVLGNILMEKRAELMNDLSNENNSNKKVEYTFFFNLTSPFSNFHPSRFEYKDFTFISNEQFMMFSKAKNFGDEETANRIINIFNEFQKEPGIFKSMEDKNCFQLSSAFQRGEITREQILSNRDSVTAWNTIHKKIKQLGREVKNFDDTFWAKRREKIVLFGAREKFNQNPDLKQIFMNTGDTLFAESSPYDRVWGIFLDEAKARKTPPSQWPGLNLLGKVLDTLKAEFKNELVKRPKP